MDVLIREDDLNGSEIARLLRNHLDEAAEHTPPDSIHALDLAGLQAPEVTFWSVWSEGTLVGCGALRELSAEHSEIKSMHTAKSHRGRGIGARVLAHILDVARARGYRRVSLETGSMEAFAPARALYARFGFKRCPPFGDYYEDPNSVCMTVELETR